MKSIIYLLIIKCTVITTNRFSQILENHLEDEWIKFKLIYNKTYKSVDEDRIRREIFIENRWKIAKFNEVYAQTGRCSFVQQINPYADMLHYEFDRNLNGYNRSSNKQIENLPVASTYIRPFNITNPESIDWREFGAVTSVKNQGLCAACWAFSAAGALEGQNFRKTGNLIELSVQNLIDCSRPYGNDGCNGGLMDGAFHYVRDNSGINSEEDYPYDGKDLECRYQYDNIASTCTGYVRITEGDEEALETAVATLGPISAVLDASRNTLQFYSNGVYYDGECRNSIDDMNHAVLIVGYGVETNGQKYWLIKNSYGTQWGIDGYIKLAKNVDNHCGIATFAVYPLV